MTPGPSPRAGIAEGGRNMAEAKEEGPGPRGRVSGGREGRSKGRGQGAGSGREGARAGAAGHRREPPGCSVRGAAVPPLSRALTGGPGGPGGASGAEGPEPGLRGPLQPGDRRPPARAVAAARSLQAGEQCCPRWPLSRAATQGFLSFPLVLLKESVQASFS